MTTPDNKPLGYFEYILAIDCESTGLCFNSDSPVYNPETGERHQAISWGMVVADTHTLQPVDELYVEIKWNDNSLKQLEQNPEFGKKAQEIHQLTATHLEDNGVSEEEAVVKIANMIIKYWGPDSKINLLGHNVATFDMMFLHDMMNRVGVPIKTAHRHLDSWSVGFGVMEQFNSNDLFDSVGLPTRSCHNALEDAKMALESVRRIRQTWNTLLSD